ncbi:MAG: FtsX-like permease family protein [Planctomycetota bacterium]
MTGRGGGSYLSVLAGMAVIDVTRRPWRLGFLAAGIALAGAAAFGALVFHAALGRSLDRSLARLGADAAILPAGVTAHLTPVLLTVEPSASILPPGALERLATTPVVQAVAPQRTLSLADAAGHLPIDVVVFDPVADLTVLPWVAERLERPFTAGDVLVGGRRPEAVGERIVVQGVELVVQGRLGLTGVGPFERSWFIGPDTARRLAAAKVVTADGRPFPPDPLGEPSGALVRLVAGRGPEELRFAAASVPEVRLVAGGGSQIEVRQAVKVLADTSLGILLLSLVAPAVLVGVAYAGMLAERRRELGTLLALGVPRGGVVATVALEAALASLAGVLVGIVLAVAVIAGFLRTIGFTLEQRAIELTLPSPGELVLDALASGATVATTAIAAAALAAWWAAGRQPWFLLRGDSP